MKGSAIVLIIVGIILLVLIRKGMLPDLQALWGKLTK
jgi:hypothetical protein